MVVQAYVNIRTGETDIFAIAEFAIDNIDDIVDLTVKSVQIDLPLLFVGVVRCGCPNLASPAVWP